MGARLKTFGSIYMTFNVKSVSLGVKRELCKKAIVPTMTISAEAFSLRMNARNK